MYILDKNKFGFPISIKRADVPFIYNSKWRKKCKDYSTYTVKGKFIIELPILAETQLVAIVNPEEIWKELSNYISSLSNDKASVFVPNKCKIVNLGFDKKESFRNIK